MKTSRVRVHRNSVYYRNSRITSWRANEQSIVPPTPETRCPKNFASTGSAARKQVLRIGTVKRCSIRERFIFPPLARTRNFTSPEAEAFNQLGRGGETEFSGALKGRSRGWTRVFRECPNGAKWCRSMDGGGHHRCAALAARIFDGLAVASATHGSFVEFHAIWVNGRADQTAPIFCRPILAPPRNVNDTANLVSMPATTQCRGLVDVLLSLSLFLSMLTTHGIGVLTLLVFLSALRFAAMLESCYQVSHTHTLS